MAKRREEILYLREKAQQFRKLATDHNTEVSPRLVEIAQELEARAAELERGA